MGHKSEPREARLRSGGQGVKANRRPLPPGCAGLLGIPEQGRAVARKSRVLLRGVFIKLREQGAKRSTPTVKVRGFCSHRPGWESPSVCAPFKWASLVLP